MVKIIIYVEGPSDKYAMQALLESLIEQKNREGVSIDFFETPQGDRKNSLLTKVPQKAANILMNDPHSIVVAMPDLYPRNRVFPHESFDEMRQGILNRFADALQSKNPANAAIIKDRFKVFCFKHDLEALVLAAEGSLQARLGVDSLKKTWVLPVEDQDHDHPPKRVVEELFTKHGKTYRDTVDAPLILGGSNYQEVAGKCPQCFKPFVQFLTDAHRGNS